MYNTHMIFQSVIHFKDFMTHITGQVSGFKMNSFLVIPEIGPQREDLRAHVTSKISCLKMYCFVVSLENVVRACNIRTFRALK